MKQDTTDYSLHRPRRRRTNTLASLALRLVQALLALVVAFVLVIVVQGYISYKEALEMQPFDRMEARIHSQEFYTPARELPSYYLYAVVAIEDHRFYQHKGFDGIATTRALFNDLRSLSFREGGSTITQQLAKNEYFTQDKTINRKISEIFMAAALERHFSKEEILELYVNSIYFGESAYGVGAASQLYFGIPAAHMDFNQATLLAGVPNAPSLYALTEGADLAAKRQRLIIDALIKYRFIHPGPHPEDLYPKSLPVIVSTDN